MKAIYIDAFLEKNLGDDLFIKIICDRYKNVNFISCSNTRYKKKDLPKNMKIYSGIFVKIFNYVFAKFFNKKNFFNQLLSKNYEMIVCIGGSLFIEWDKLENLKKNYELFDNKKYYILGINFGPYKTTEYFEYIKKNIFINAIDICFRDIYSYELFKNLKNVRYAPDILFLMNEKKIINSKRIVMSIIDCKNRFEPYVANNYYKTIVDLINEFIKEGYEVNLMSFCKIEKDVCAIKNILSKLKNKTNITTFYYDGDTKKAIENLNNSEIILGSRFHANIIGLLLDKRIIPVAYSDKTINVLKDLNYEGNIFDIRDVNTFNSTKILSEKYKYNGNLKNIMIKAENHFKVLDGELNDK